MLNLPVSDALINGAHNSAVIVENQCRGFNPKLHFYFNANGVVKISFVQTTKN